MSEPKGRGAAWTVFVPPDPPERQRKSDEGKKAQMKRDGEAGGAPEASGEAQ
jgi:hypothetical protein